MILPVRYLWEQLDGPQVSAVSNALFEYWKSIFDDKLEYFNNISVDTASDIHLTLLGLLSGLVRPVIQEPDRDFFYFTEFAENPTTHGFSDLADLTVGGKFSKLDSSSNIHNTSLNEEHYRALLRAWVNGEGDIGSLQLLDDICNELTKLDLGDITPFYQFEFMEGDDIPVDRAPGDVYIDMRSSSNWNNPLHIYAVIQGIANSAYAPQPRIFISIGVSGQVSPPVISPESGSYDEPITVSIQVANPTDAQIYYTTDGSDPTPETGTLYTDPFTVSESCVVKAIGVAPYYGNSNITRATYAIE